MVQQMDGTLGQQNPRPARALDQPEQNCGGPARLIEPGDELGRRRTQDASPQRLGRICRRLGLGQTTAQLPPPVLSL
jgi:hypothetical protein